MFVLFANSQGMLNHLFKLLKWGAIVEKAKRQG